MRVLETYKIGGVGTVACGPILQGTLKSDELLNVGPISKTAHIKGYAKNIKLSSIESFFELI
jgi:GTPase